MILNDFKVVRKMACLECPHSKNRHDNTHDNVMEMNRLDEYVSTNSDANPRIRSSHFNKISLLPTINHWTDMAQAFLEAHVEMQFGNPTPLKEFMNLELGEPFRLDEGDDVWEIITSEEDA